MTSPLHATGRADAPPEGASPPPPAAPGPDADLGFALPPPARLTRTRALALTLGLAALFGGAFVIRWLPALHAREALEAETRSAGVATPRVPVIMPTVVSIDRAVQLPGSVQPLEETVVYPRAGGYVKRWLVDLGDKVKEGDLLAEIDTPDLDQQLAQARAQLAQAEAGLLSARANARLSRATLARFELLVPEGLASKQDYDKQKAQAELDEAAVTVASAAIAAQRANVQLVGQLKSFGHVVAPFSGTITSRTVERGMLVTAGTATPLFKIAATDPVRVLAQVPQDVAPSVRVGLPVNVSVREFPGRSFQGKVERSAGALDPQTRTMLTEVRVPNPKGELFTGMYAQVALGLSSPRRVLALPATALLNDAAGQRVAIVDATGHIRFASVVVDRDTGPTVEISGGLEGNEQVVKLPSAELTEGRAVEVVK